MDYSFKTKSDVENKPFSKRKQFKAKTALK